jgi:hypothetical protein
LKENFRIIRKRKIWRTHKRKRLRETIFVNSLKMLRIYFTIFAAYLVKSQIAESLQGRIIGGRYLTMGQFPSLAFMIGKVENIYLKIFNRCGVFWKSSSFLIGIELIFNILCSTYFDNQVVIFSVIKQY